MKALHELTATEARALLGQGKISAEQLVRATLEYINEREPEIEAWVCLRPDLAIQQAKELDRQGSQGLLHGIPFGAKDIFDTRDFPTTFGSPIYAHNQPAIDAVHIALMKAAGGVLLGKTVTAEFATFKGGKTHNPQRHNHTPGGSSSGSAAAVGAHMVTLATGSQTAASVIRPASFCGVIGFKPTFGKISLGGVKSLSPSLDTLGCFTRSVGDAALGVAAMSGDHALAEIAPLKKKPRIASTLTYDAKQASADAVAAVNHAALLAEDVWQKDVPQIDLPKIFSDMSEIQGRIMWSESARSFTFERENYPEQLSQQLRGLIKQGAQISYAQYSADLLRAEEARHVMHALLTDNYDVLISPAAVGEAPQGLTLTGDPIFSRVWTLMGLPSITLPLFQGSTGLPVGVQLVAARGRDAYLLSVADALMKAR